MKTLDALTNGAYVITAAGDQYRGFIIRSSTRPLSPQSRASLHTRRDQQITNWIRSVENSLYPISFGWHTVLSKQMIAISGVVFNTATPRSAISRWWWSQQDWVALSKQNWFIRARFHSPISWSWNEMKQGNETPWNTMKQSNETPWNSKETAWNCMKQQWNSMK